MTPYYKRSSQRVLALSDEHGRSASNLMAYLIERSLDLLFPTSDNPS